MSQKNYLILFIILFCIIFIIFSFIIKSVKDFSHIQILKKTRHYFSVIALVLILANTILLFIQNTLVFLN